MKSRKKELHDETNIELRRSRSRLIQSIRLSAPAITQERGQGVLKETPYDKSRGGAEAWQWINEKDVAVKAIDRLQHHSHFHFFWVFAAFGTQTEREHWGDGGFCFLPDAG